MIKRVLIDLSTQLDFLASDGAIPVINREHLIPKLRRAFAWARLTQTPVVSAIESCGEHEPSNGVPRHCVEGTIGQRKIYFTLLLNRMFLQADNSLSIPANLFREHRQVIFRKRSDDFLGNPKVDRLLTESVVGEYVIAGVGLEAGIKSLALGLITRMKRVAVVYDACGFWNVAAADLSLRQMDAKGVRLICVEELVKMRRRYPSRNGNGRANQARHLHDPRAPMPAFMRARLDAIRNSS